MTASQKIIEFGRETVAFFSALTPLDLAINLGLTLLALGLAWGAAVLVRRATHATARRLPGPATAERKVRTSRLARLIATVTAWFAFAIAALAIAYVWGVDLLAAAGELLGGAVVSALFNVALVVLAAVAAAELAGYLIGRGLRRLSGRARHPRRRAQLTTLAPLLKGVAQAAIGVVAVLMVLSEVGVKIGPLLAGAGVVGIALGLGAQTLVKDIITGAFLVMEDIVTVGDVVRIGDSGGQVEQMTLRTIRLRDFDGTLHVFPNSEAQILHNMTKSFSYYVIGLQVSYGSDIDRALALMGEVGEELRADPAFSELILEPIEVVGVDDLAESGVLLKARIKTQPIQQWTVGREYNRRIKLAFDRCGIEIPFPHMQVVLPENQLSELVRH
jgi:small conductance mechanosensitive channel